MRYVTGEAMTAFNKLGYLCNNEVDDLYLEWYKDISSHTGKCIQFYVDDTVMAMTWDKETFDCHPARLTYDEIKAVIAQIEELEFIKNARR